MKKQNFKFFLILSTPITILSSIPFISSCSLGTNEEDAFNTTLGNEKYIDLYKFSMNNKYSHSKFKNLSKELGHKYSNAWYSQLKDANWNYADPNNPTGVPLNLHCSTAKQALALYCNSWGDFWNIELHQNKEPTDKPDYLMKGQVFPGNKLSILGKDYKYISECLENSSIPENTISYHGVEFMEVEYWNQLKDYITEVNGKYDYSKCVGQNITSYGFISTSLDKKWASDFSEGEDWVNGGYYLPLKDKFVFRIFIPKNINGVSYVSYFNFMDTYNNEDQIIIDRNSEFKIVDYYKEGDNNYFDLLYLGINKQLK